MPPVFGVMEVMAGLLYANPELKSGPVKFPTVILTLYTAEKGTLGDLHVRFILPVWVHPSS